MKLSEVDKKARSMGIKHSWIYSKRDLIRMMQKKEGNFPCFETAKNGCDQVCCLWRIDCLK